MRTFADIKRAIKPGVRLFVVSHEYRPELAGTMRVVTKVQTNGYYFESLSDPGKRLWSGFASASCYSFPDARTFRHDEGLTCCCGASSSSPHSDYCNITTGKRFAWTMRIIDTPSGESSADAHSLSAEVVK